MPQEWNAAAYHKVAAPQTDWGRKVLARVPLRGDELVIDAGCGSGRLTAELVERLPRGFCVAIDQSWNMLLTARANLRPVFGGRVGFVQVSLPATPFVSAADVIVSTATFHWVQDHASLFQNLFLALKPGGLLIAQCGGGPNLEHAHALAERVMHHHVFQPYFAGWTGPWEFSTPDETATRLRTAGFADVDTGLESTPVTLASEADYREFVTTVIYHAHLARVPSAPLRQRFVDEVTALSSAESPAFTLDYWRLNMRARKPGNHSA
jgi:trans-aconitate methyltransferase